MAPNAIGGLGGREKVAHSLVLAAPILAPYYDLVAPIKPNLRAKGAYLRNFVKVFEKLIQISIKLS